jgi:hypothetical protein
MSGSKRRAEEEEKIVKKERFALKDERTGEVSAKVYPWGLFVEKGYQVEIETAAGASCFVRIVPTESTIEKIVNGRGKEKD